MHNEFIQNFTVILIILQIIFALLYIFDKQPSAVVVGFNLIAPIGLASLLLGQKVMDKHSVLFFLSSMIYMVGFMTLTCYIKEDQ